GTQFCQSASDTSTGATCGDAIVAASPRISPPSDGFGVATGQSTAGWEAKALMQLQMQLHLPSPACDRRWASFGPSSRGPGYHFETSDLCATLNKGRPRRVAGRPR